MEHWFLMRQVIDHIRMIFLVGGGVVVFALGYWISSGVRTVMGAMEDRKFLNSLSKEDYDDLMVSLIEKRNKTWGMQEIYERAVKETQINQETREWILSGRMR